MGDRIYADRMGGGVKITPPHLNCRTKRARKLIFFMEVPAVMYFPKIYRYWALSAKCLMILTFLGQNLAKSC